MNLPEEIRHMWEQNAGDCEERVCGWIRDIEANRAFIAQARRAFREWEPLRVYLSLTSAKSKGYAVFSLRYIGQEVAQIKVNNKLDVLLHVTDGHAKWNNKYFGMKLEPCKCDWDSPQARKFRNYFKDIDSGKRKIKTHSPEHQVETHIIKEMGKTQRANKFDGKFSGIQPIKYEKCPFQLSTPIAGNTGIPSISVRGGNMDIVARRRVAGNKIRISIWELKKPDVSGSVINKAIKQVIIYSSTLRMMLRSECGGAWYELLGFSKGLPKKLEIEAVICISINDRTKFELQIAKLIDEMPFYMGNDLIVPYVAYYNDKTYNVEQFEEITG